MACDCPNGHSNIITIASFLSIAGFIFCLLFSTIFATIVGGILMIMVLLLTCNEVPTKSTFCMSIACLIPAIFHIVMAVTIEQEDIQLLCDDLDLKADRPICNVTVYKVCNGIGVAMWIGIAFLLCQINDPGLPPGVPPSVHAINEQVHEAAAQPMEACSERKPDV